MTEVLCYNNNCKFLGANGFCTKKYVTLYNMGICSEWFDMNNNVRIMPMYAVEEEMEKLENVNASERPS